MLVQQGHRERRVSKQVGRVAPRAAGGMVGYPLPRYRPTLPRPIDQHMTLMLLPQDFGIGLDFVFARASFAAGAAAVTVAFVMRFVA